MTGAPDTSGAAGELPQPTIPSIAQATGALDSTVHHPVRLGILTVLAAIEQCAFGYLRDALEVTDGNLSRNISVLEEAGLIAVTKGYEGRRPRTWLAITTPGRSALDQHLTALRVLADWRPPSAAPPA